MTLLTLLTHLAQLVLSFITGAIISYLSYRAGYSDGKAAK